MPFRPEPSLIDLDRLLASLYKSNLQRDNQPLFQVIDRLIKAVRQNQGILETRITNVVPGLPDETYLTSTDESADLPNSRNLLAGSNVTFDDGTVNERTVNVDIKDDADYLTWSDESADLANSRQLLAGTNISFDDATPNERTINVSGVSPDNVRDVGYWTPLVAVVGAGDVEWVVTDGGAPIAVWTPTP